MSAWLHLRWMRDTPGNSLIAVRGKRGGWKRELDDRRATRTTNLIERERQREKGRERRWKLEERTVEKGGEKEREKAILSYASSAPETPYLSLSLSLVPATPRSSSSSVLLDQNPSSPRPAISSPFRDVCNRFERLERPREPTRASAFSVYHRLPSIFTIFTSRPRDPTAYNQTSRTEEKGTCDPLPTFPSIFFPPSLRSLDSMSLCTSLPLTSTSVGIPVPVLESREFKYGA